MSRAGQRYLVSVAGPSGVEFIIGPMGEERALSMQRSLDGDIAEMGATSAYVAGIETVSPIAEYTDIRDEFLNSLTKIGYHPAS